MSLFRERPDDDLNFAMLSLSGTLAAALLCLAIVSGCLHTGSGPGPTPVEPASRVAHLTRQNLRAKADAAATVAREIRDGSLTTNMDVMDRWNGLLDEAGAVHVRDFQAAVEDISPAQDAPRAEAWEAVERGLREVAR